MKVSFNWLKKHVDLEGISPEQVADKLTFAGAEVESIERLAEGTNLVIGQIKSCVAHPDSDHLHVLQVDEGPFGLVQIVCGAPNAREGLKVIVARVGAKLPKVDIAASKIRGVESNGMCCSLLELGVEPKFLSDAQKAGIEELPEDAPVGETDVLGYLGLSDVVLDLSLLPNRPDLYALNNVAREVACLFERKLNLDEIQPVKKEKASFTVGSSAKGCPLFSGRAAYNVETKPSPKWLKEVLLSSGIRSINNIVDIGNFVMLLTGQPLNMYDLDKLPAKELTVRDDLEGEFKAMDGNSYPLQKGDLVVTSAGKPMCLAGIMTAEECKVDENTKNILVEAAYFASASIRHTSSRIGLISDSSQRFCKGINPHQAEYVQDVTSALLELLAGKPTFSETVLFDEMDHEPKTLEVTLDYINGRLGTSFDEETILKVLKRDYFQAEKKGQGYLVHVPPYRIDVDTKADITEEVIRLLGYENVPSSLPRVDLSLTGLTERQIKQRQVRHYLLGRGLSEALTYTLLSKEDAAKFNYLPAGEPYVLSNPMTVEREVVRTHLLHSLLATASYNVARQVPSGSFFEISDVDSEGLQGRHLAYVLFGNKHGRGLIGETPYDFFDAKGLILGLFDILGINLNRVQLVPWSLGGEEMHPYQSAEIRMGKNLLGYFGALHPLALKRYGLKNAIACEIDFNALLDLKVGLPKASIPLRFPVVERDLALVVPDSITYETLRREVSKASPLVLSVTLFDRYVGPGVKEGYASLALRLTLGDKEKTLNEADITSAMEKVLSALKANLGIELRQ